jgi:hypothetical protein
VADTGRTVLSCIVSIKQIAFAGRTVGLRPTQRNTVYMQSAFLDSFGFQGERLKRYNLAVPRPGLTGEAAFATKEDGMLGGYLSDLEKGDVFKPIEYVLTPFICGEYAHGVEEAWEGFHSPNNPAGKQMRPPTLIHAEKMRLLEENCDKERRVAGMKGPDARVHYEYHAKQHSPAYVGETIVVTGHIVDKYIKREREYLWYYLEARTKDGRLLTTYNDRTLLRYKPVGVK